MPKAGRHTGPSDAGSAAARLAQREATAAEARQAEERERAAAGVERYAMSRAEVDRHHGELRWVLDAAIGYAVSGDVEMAEFTIRHAVHVGISPVVLAGAFAELGAIQASRGSAP